MNRRASIPCSWALIALLCAACPAAAPDAALESVTLHVGFGPRSFLGINETDAEAAYKVFTRSVGHGFGYDVDLIAHKYDSDEALAADAKDGVLHYAVTDVWSFLEEDLASHVEPRFLSARAGREPPDEYLLLVRGDAPCKNVQDLRGRHLLLLESVDCLYSLLWIRTLTLENVGETEADFFGKTEVHSNPMDVLLPVFFGQSDACVATRSCFGTMCELNPQLGRSLRSIAVSEPLAGGLVCLSRQGWKSARHRGDMIESLETLHETPHGRQLLTLFKTDRLVPFEDRFALGTRALQERLERLAIEGGAR